MCNAWTMVNIKKYAKIINGILWNRHIRKMDIIQVICLTYYYYTHNKICQNEKQFHKAYLNLFLIGSIKTWAHLKRNKSKI